METTQIHNNSSDIKLSDANEDQQQTAEVKFASTGPDFFDYIRELKHV